jgi:FkbM family methyltransferase
MLESSLRMLGRIFGKPPGLERAIRYLSPPGQLQNCGYYREFPDGYSFQIDPATLIGWNIHFFLTYEPEVREQIKDVLRPGRVCLDVGANVGWHTLLMASLVGPAGRVFAFEPNASTRDRLTKVIADNGFSQVVIRGEALSDQVGFGWFQAPRSGTLWDGTGRLAMKEEADYGHVPCATADSVVQSSGLDRLDLIKIDVEGWELPVLCGSVHSIKRFRPRIIFEFDPHYITRCGADSAEILELFRSLDYELFVLRRRHAPSKVTNLDSKAGNLLGLPSGRR